MALSSPGIGSGLDIKSIVSQLVALERKPLAQLQSNASNYQARLSAVGQLRSQLDNLQSMASRLASPSTWTALNVTSSLAAVNGRITDASQATPSQFSLEVSQLASAQTFATDFISTGSLEGSLTISIGNFNEPSSFTAGIPILISETDTLQDVARKINASNEGVSATLLKDSSGERLLLRSSKTGEDFGFKIGVATPPGSQLSALSLSSLVAEPGQTIMEAKDTLAAINGATIRSNTTSFDEVVPGISFTANAITSPSTPALITIARDTAQMRTVVNNFIQSFNALSNAIAEMTRFNPMDKSAGTLQGDPTVIGIQSAMRRLVGSNGSGGSDFSWLSEIGIAFTKEGTLEIRPGKNGKPPALDLALQNPSELAKFFGSTDASVGLGLAVRIVDFANGLISASGPLSTRRQALQSSIERNTREQDRLSERISRNEERLLAQYSRLDTQLSQLTALGSYVTQQVTLWNSQKK